MGQIIPYILWNIKFMIETTNQISISQRLNNSVSSKVSMPHWEVSPAEFGESFVIGSVANPMETTWPMVEKCPISRKLTRPGKQRKSY
jgi:hypothetical protein